MSIHQRPLEYMFPHGMGVVFDCDGVVVDSEPASLEAFRRTYQEVEIELSQDDLESVIGRTAEASVSLMWERHGYFMEIKDYLERKQHHYEIVAKEKGILALPGVVDLINELENSQVRFALASSNRPEAIETSLREAHLQDRFSIIISGADVSWGKPDPEIFLLAAEQLSLPPERCIAIEDSSSGVEAACRAGMTCIGVTNTYTAQTLSRADCVVQSLEEVNVRMLRKLFEANLQRSGRA